MSSIVPAGVSLPHARRTTAVFIILFWVAQFGLLTAQRMNGVDGGWDILLPRALTTCLAIGLSFMIVAAQARLRGRTVQFRLLAAVGMAIIACIAHSAGNILIFRLVVPVRTETFQFFGYLLGNIQWLWTYFALSGMIYALLSSFEVQESERQISTLQRIAHDAQLRALRYQLNPHFMFNTLNSITTLIRRKNSADAEAMVENLADFLRAGLTLDPLQEIPLSREIELQSLYLAIETVRFVDRLRVTVDVSDEAMHACVPSLITQPIVENVIRHAVANSSVPVELVIAARRRGAVLELTITNSPPDRPRPRKSQGTGVGLANVAERLRARFGEAISFSSGETLDGHYVVAFVIPYLPETAAR